MHEHDEITDHEPATDDGASIIDRLRDETGAQAMEYAMLGGAGVASVSLITWLTRQPWLREAIESMVVELLSRLGGFITDILPF